MSAGNSGIAVLQVTIVSRFDLLELDGLAVWIVVHERGKYVLRPCGTLPYRLQMRMRAVATTRPINMGYCMQQLLLAIIRQGCGDFGEHRLGGMRQVRIAHLAHFA